MPRPFFSDAPKTIGSVLRAARYWPLLPGLQSNNPDELFFLHRHSGRGFYQDHSTIDPLSVVVVETTAAVPSYSKRELIFLAVAIAVICMLAWIVMFAE